MSYSTEQMTDMLAQKIRQADAHRIPLASGALAEELMPWITDHYGTTAPATVTQEEIDAETQRRYGWIDSDDDSLLDAANSFEEGVKWALSFGTTVEVARLRARSEVLEKIHTEVSKPYSVRPPYPAREIKDTPNEGVADRD